MKSKTYKTQGKPSGSLNRARAAEEAGAQKAAQKTARAATKGWQSRFLAVGPPPENSAQRVEWANRLSAEITWEQIIAPNVRSSQERKLILEGVRTLGMTAVKALYEERLKKIESKVFSGAEKDGDADAGDGLEDL